MTPKDTNSFAMEDPDAQLERMFYDEYLRAKGHTSESLSGLPAAEAKRIRTEACTYASVKLAEIRDKAQFVRQLRGTTETG